jgi:putative CRISPR-associated protein (TIGR02620 family)
MLKLNCKHLKIKNMKTIVVTRHQSMIKYLKEKNIIDEDAIVIPHATENDLKGNRVIGVLPVHLAVFTKEYVSVPLLVPKELRGKELTIEEVREYAATPKTYIVKFK